ncbi:hypothetical protein FQN55_004674 [Onygenales sp. PD_40]|nr:hypothetical protein FQN55_004674 [Onygenales sp. PD_40]
MAYDRYHSPHPYDQQAYGNTNPIPTPTEYSNPHIPPAPNPDPYYQQHPPYGDNLNYSSELNQPAPPPQHQHQPPPPPPPQIPSSNPPAPPGAYPPEPAQYYQPNAPINEAVNAAVNRADPASYNVNPDLVNQITASVIEQLSRTKLDPNNQGQPQPAPPPPQYHSPQPPFAPQPYPPPPGPSVSDYSPSSAAGQVYTPPSPYKPPDEQQRHYHSSPPPQSAQPRYGQNIHVSPRASPIPEQSRTSPFQEPRSPYHEPRSPFEDNSQPRPRGPARLGTIDGQTPLEKIWGQLFDIKNDPTPKLGQLLRGVAVHLIECYSPKNSLVITPAKMQKYYADTRVQGDTYPWQDIFDDDKSNLSRLYRKLKAEHHLVQDVGSFGERPDIPGLTPRGFERWVTLLIQTNPDQEYERIRRTVREMPISNPDDKKERFPKDITRRLFPHVGDQHTKLFVEDAIVTDCNVDLSIPTSFPAETQQQPRTATHRYRVSSGGTTPIAPTTPSSSHFDRRRYSQSQPVDPDELPPTRPIERERKPYTAQPGGGKTYNDDLKPSTPTSSGHHHLHSHHDGGGGRSSRRRSPSISRPAYGHSEADFQSHARHGSGSGPYVVGAGPVPSPPFLDEFDDAQYKEARREGEWEREREWERKGYESGRDRERDGLHDTREREREAREKERQRYGTSNDDSSRGGWVSDEDYYRSGILGGKRGDYEQGSSWGGGGGGGGGGYR